jgi:hypothetical protein
MEFDLYTIPAECAFIATDACLRGLRREVFIAVFAVWPDI